MNARKLTGQAENANGDLLPNIRIGGRRRKTKTGMRTRLTMNREDD